MKRIIIFASGSGSNAENIISYFKNKTKIDVIKVYCNNKDAKVFDRCKMLNMSCLHFTKSDLNTVDFINNVKNEADFIILAGFLLKIPTALIDVFPNKIINIHPALLPKYGGKGMYGIHVHNAVKLNNEKESGITIHFVNEKYDEGAIIFQAKTTLDKNDSPQDIAAKIHLLEQRYFPRVIENLIFPINE